MKKQIPAWISDILKDFRKGIIQYLIVSAGLGAIFIAYMTGVGATLFNFIGKNLAIIAVIILFMLFYILGRLNEKSKSLRKEDKKKKENEISIIQQELIQHRSLKWDVTIYSNGNFKVAPYPYCALHDMRLVEQWPLYFCPRFGNDCNSQMPIKDLPIVKAEVESYIESELRKWRKEQLHQIEKG